MVVSTVGMGRSTVTGLSLAYPVIEKEKITSLTVKSTEDNTWVTKSTITITFQNHSELLGKVWAHINF